MGGIDTSNGQYDHHVWSYRLWLSLTCDLESYQRIALYQPRLILRPYLRFNPNAWYHR